VAKYYRTAAPAATEPLTSDEVKLWAKIETDDDHAIVNRLITSARERAEEITGRALVSQSWKLFLDRFPTGVRDYSAPARCGNGQSAFAIEIPVPPLLGITSVKYYDTSNALTTMSSSLYEVDGDGSIAPAVLPAVGTSWPSTYARANAVIVEWTAGYATVPSCVIEWMLRIIADAYANREATLVGNFRISPHPLLDGLLDPIRVRRM